MIMLKIAADDSSCAGLRRVTKAASDIEWDTEGLCRPSTWHGPQSALLYCNGVFNPLSTCKPAGSAEKNPERNACRLVDVRNECPTGRKWKPHEALENFFSDNVEERRKACACVASLFCDIGEDFIELVSFLQGYEGTEMDDTALEILCSQLRLFFEHARTKRNAGKSCSNTLWTATALKAFSGLLFGPLVHRDAQVRDTAVEAYSSLVCSCKFVDEGIIFVDEILQYSTDDCDKCRAAAARCIPSALTFLQSLDREESTEETETLMQKLVNAFSSLCLDLSFVVRHAAGQTLPAFVGFVSAQADWVQSNGNLPNNKTSTGTRKTGEDYMLVLYTTVQKLIHSQNESSKIHGVRAMLEMTRINAQRFKTLGMHFLPLFSADPMWRIRSLICENLDELVSFQLEATGQASESTEHFVKKANFMAALLLKFLSDDNPKVRTSALTKIPQVAKMLQSTSFVTDEWMAILQRIADGNSSEVDTRIRGTCLDCVLNLIPLASPIQRHTFVDLSLQLAKNGLWNHKAQLISNLSIMKPSELDAVSSLILDSEFMKDDELDCWRIRAAMAQQSRFLVGLAADNLSDAWWRRFRALLGDPVWAVRQEAGSALRLLLQDIAGTPDSHNALHKVISERVLPLIMDISKNPSIFIQSDAAFYLLKMWDFVPPSLLRTEVHKLLEDMARDSAPCKRIAVARLLRLRYRTDEVSTSMDPMQKQLGKLLERLRKDVDPDVRYEANVDDDAIKRKEKQPT